VTSLALDWQSQNRLYAGTADGRVLVLDIKHNQDSPRCKVFRTRVAPFVAICQRMRHTDWGKPSLLLSHPFAGVARHGRPARLKSHVGECIAWRVSCSARSWPHCGINQHLQHYQVSPDPQSSHTWVLSNRAGQFKTRFFASISTLVFAVPHLLCASY
jgi:hypothetical protein